MANSILGRMPPTFDASQHPFSCGEALEQLDDYILAAGATDNGQKKAMLRSIGGKKIRNDSKTAVEDFGTSQYDECKKKLLDMYEPLKHATAERYRFRKMKQGLDESIEDYKNRLWIQSERCGFVDQDEQIRDQIVFKCQYKKLRRGALKHGWELKDLMKEGRNLEMTSKNAELIEGTKLKILIQKLKN